MVKHISKQHNVIPAISIMTKEMSIQIINKHTKGKKDLEVIQKNLDSWAMQNIEVGANMGLLLHDIKEKPNGVVVCLATGTWGVFES